MHKNREQKLLELKIESTKKVLKNVCLTASFKF